MYTNRIQPNPLQELCGDVLHELLMCFYVHAASLHNRSHWFIPTEVFSVERQHLNRDNLRLSLQQRVFQLQL